MSAGKAQVWAFISNSTQQRLEAFAEAHGLSTNQLVEEALLHHLQALWELPRDVIVPASLVVSPESGRTIVERIVKPRRPTKATRELFGLSR